jgi:hypothetical protein
MTKVPLKEVIAAVDLNARTLWDEIDDDQRKALKSELWILNRYISNVKTSSIDQQQHFVLTVNEYFNKNWFVLHKDHPKLLWMLLCMCSYNSEKVFYHEWIGLGKKSSNKKIKILEKIYPNMKPKDIETLAEINSNDDIRELAREHGFTDKEIKDI